MPTWSMWVRSPLAGAVDSAHLAPSPCAVAPEHRDLVLAHLGPQLGVVDAEPLLGGQAQHADLPLVGLWWTGVGRLAHLLQRVQRREDGLDLAQGDQPVGLPRLLVVGEVARLDPLELHPEVAVVVLDHVAAGGRAGDDRAAPLGHEHRRPHGLAARGARTRCRGPRPRAPGSSLPEAAPLGLVLGVLVLPEPVVLGPPVDDGLAPQLVQQLDLVRRADDADRDAPAVQHVLHGVAAEPARGAPDEDHVALLHPGGVVAHQHPVAGRVAQRVDRPPPPT